MSLTRLLPAWLHAIADYAVGAGLIVIALAAGGSGKAVAAGVVVGATILAASVFTRYPLGVVKVLPFTVHSAGDYLAAALLLVAPFALNFHGTDGGLTAVYIVAGLAVLGVSLITNYQYSDKRAASRRETTSKARASRPIRPRAGIYTRLSSDPDGTSTATERQRQDCRRLADARGYEVVDVYEDNDTSAYKRGVVRPAFERMVTDLAGGAIDAVVVWRTDRLARQPRDLERFIDAAETHQGGLLSVTEPDFSGSSGLLILRMLTAFANHESGVKAERVARKMKELAERGDPRTGGQRTFGDNRDMTPNVREAEVFVASVFLILKGESYSSVMAQWTAAGITTPTGKQWRLSNWRRMLTAPVFAGLRSYHGEVLPGNWQGLITPELREQLIAVIGGRHQEPRRRVSVHLLTGIAHCSCGAPMNGISRPGYGGKSPYAEYRCNVLRGGCGCTTIRANKLEPAVVEQFFELVSSLKERAAVDPTAVLLALRDDEANLAQLVRDHYVERIIGRGAFMAAKKQLDERIDQRRALVARAGPMSWLRAVGAVHAEWERRDLTWRREMLRAVVGVVVAPAGRDRYKDRVTISPAMQQTCPSPLERTSRLGSPHPSSDGSNSLADILRLMVKARGTARPDAASASMCSSISTTAIARVALGDGRPSVRRANRRAHSGSYGVALVGALTIGG